MADQNSKPTHTVMPKKLAEALMESGVHHFDAGGLLSVFGGGSSYQPQQLFSKDQLDLLNAQQQDVYKQQQSLGNTLLAQSQGQGPNPAQLALQNATGENVAQQNSLMAGQRGASTNPALIARLAAQQGAGIQQRAVGQGALMQAQQQLAAQQALQQQQANMASGNIGAQGIMTGVFNNNENLKAKMAGANAEAGNKLGSNLFSGLGDVFTKGIPQLLGGSTEVLGNGGALLGGAGETGAGAVGGAEGVGSMAEGAAMVANKGGQVPSSSLLNGGGVPGKAQVKGDSIKNDNQLALLSPGEAVVPRSIMMAENAPERAAEFIKHLKGNKKGYASVIDSKKPLKDRVDALENFFKGGAC